MSKEMTRDEAVAAGVAAVDEINQIIDDHKVRKLAKANKPRPSNIPKAPTLYFNRIMSMDVPDRAAWARDEARRWFLTVQADWLLNNWLDERWERKLVTRAQNFYRSITGQDISAGDLGALYVRDDDV